MDKSGEVMAADNLGKVIEPNDLNHVNGSDNGGEISPSNNPGEVIQPSGLSNFLQFIDVGGADQPGNVDEPVRPDDLDEGTEFDKGLSYHGVLVEYTHRNDNIDSKTFHDWANNKHGPERVKLEYIESGRRYRAMDDDDPKYMTVYEVKALGKLHEESFTSLGKCHTATGLDLSEYVDIHTNVYDVVCARGVDNPGFGKMLIVSRWAPRSFKGLLEIVEMYEVHIDGLSKIPGWIRSRVLATNDTFAEHGYIFFLTIHEYESDSLYGKCQEHQDAINSIERARLEDLKAFQERRVYHLVHEISPNPRDLTFRPHSGRFIESTFVCEDGVERCYRIEGSRRLEAPLIIFVNTGLTRYTIWDQFIHLFCGAHSKYRLLRYEMRDAEQVGNSKYADKGIVRVHTEDLMVLLKCLLVERIHAVVGAGLGGAIAISYAVNNAEKVDRFIACSIHPSSYEGVTEWKVQPNEDDKVDFDATCKGQQLVNRWFRPDKSNSPVANHIKEMIENGDRDVALNAVHEALEGLVLQDDTETDTKVKTPLVSEFFEHSVKGLLVAGEDDMNLVDMVSKVVKEVAGTGSDVQGVVVEKSGHLPMVENPQGFMDAVKDFLNAE